MKKIALALLLFTATASAQLSSSDTWIEGKGCVAASRINWATGGQGDAFLAFPLDKNGKAMGYMMAMTDPKWKITQRTELTGFVKFSPSGTTLPITISGLPPQGGSEPMLIFRIPATAASYELMIRSESVVFADSEGSAMLPIELVDIDQALSVIYECQTR